MKSYFEFPLTNEIRNRLRSYYEDLELVQHGEQQEFKTKIKVERIRRLVSFRHTDTLIDIGCSRGYLLSQIMPKIGKGIGYDISDAAIEENKKTYAHTTLSFRVYDGEQLTSEESADVITMVDVLEHVLSPDKLMQSLAQTLKPGGKLVVQVPFTGWLSEAVTKKYHHGHVRYYDPEYLRHYVERFGLSVTYVQTHNSVPFAGVWLRWQRLWNALNLVASWVPSWWYPYFGEILLIAEKPAIRRPKKAAIVVVNYNGKHMLEDCFRAVFAQQEVPFDVYMVDNNSHDGSIAFVQELFPQVHIIDSKENTGFSGGQNLGIAAALKDEDVAYVVSLNNDTIVDQGWLKALLEAAEKDPAIAAVGSQARFPDGNVQTVGLSLEPILYSTDDGGISVGANAPREQYAKEMDIFACSGVSVLYKRKALEQVGFFDHDFFAYVEDLDLGFRMRLAGWRCVYTPKSTLLHLHSQTAGARSAFKMYHVLRNSYYCAIKNLPLRELFALPFRDCVSAYKFFSQKKKQERASDEQSMGAWRLIAIGIRAYAGVLVSLPRMLRKRWKIQRRVAVSRAERRSWYKRFSRKTLG